MQSTYAKEAVLKEISQLQDFLSQPLDPDYQANHLDRANEQLQAFQAIFSLVIDLETAPLEVNFRRMTA